MPDIPLCAEPLIVPLWPDCDVPLVLPPAVEDEPLPVVPLPEPVLPAPLPVDPVPVADVPLPEVPAPVPVVEPVPLVVPEVEP